MSYSKLVAYVKSSPNCTKPRNKKIDAIVIHHVAGQGSVEAVGALFADPKRQASANYGVGSDGRIACFVEEENRSWATSNAGIDHRAITIEVSNCGGAPNWPVSDQALEATIALCVDVCRRYGFRLNYTGDKSGSLQMHKWYASTACPGPYLAGKFPYIAQEVNRRLDTEQVDTHQADRLEKKQDSSLALPRLQRGSRGEAVKALQLLLVGRGFACGKWGADGDFGADTQAALLRFRKSRGLSDEPVADRSAWRMLLGVSDE